MSTIRLSRYIVRGFLIGFSAMLILSQTGCTSSGNTYGAEDLIAMANDRGASEITLERLEDGIVTPAEHEAAISDYRACVADLGVISSEPLVNPIDGWRVTIDFDFRGVDDQSIYDAVDRCYEQFYGVIQYGYDRSAEPVMDPTLISAAKVCIYDEGIEVREQATNMDGLLGPDGRWTDDGDKIHKCVADLAREMFPDRQIVFEY